jgi:hypothetical protein
MFPQIKQNVVTSQPDEIPFLYTHKFHAGLSKRFETSATTAFGHQ